MVKFHCNKLGRDKGPEGFKAEGITPQYQFLTDNELKSALKAKLFEEAKEVVEATDAQTLMAELADVLEVIDGLCKAYAISAEGIAQIKKQKYEERGGFEKGFYLETIEMDENNPRVQHFRASPDKYSEIIDTVPKDKIIKVIEIFFPDANIYLFGSRAKGNYRVTDNINLAIDTGEPICMTRRGQINSMLDALNVAQIIDVVDLQRTPDTLKEHILREGIEWKNRMEVTYMKDISIINLDQKLSTFSDLWSPKIIAELNDSYVKVAKLKGEYVWHKHDNEDEMFLIINGNLKIELRDKDLLLKTGDMVVIPKGVEHRPVAESEVHVILIEPKTTLSTGDSKNTEDKKSTHGEWI